MMVEVAQAVLRGAVRALRVAGLMAVAVVVSLVAAAQPSTAATSHYDLAAYTYDAPALLSSQSAAVTYVRGPPSGPGVVSRGQSAFVRDRGVAAEGAGDWTRVGRWMHPDEHAAMQETGNIQWNSVGTHRVTNPATPDAYRAAPKGDIYVDYEVPTSVLRPHSEGTSIIYGPNSLQARLPGRAQPGDVPFRNMSEPR